MNDINTVTLVGRLTRDPELKQTQSGTAVCRFSIASNRSWSQGEKKREQVSFFECLAWRKLAELVGEYCSRGKQVAIQGRLEQQRWDDNGTNRQKVVVVAESIQFLGTKSNDERANTPQPPIEAPSHPSGDDIPF